MNKLIITIVLLISFHITYSQKNKGNSIVYFEKDIKGCKHIDTINIKNKSKGMIDRIIDSIHNSRVTKYNKHKESKLLKNIKNNLENTNVLFVYFGEDHTYYKKEKLKLFEKYNFLFDKNKIVTLIYSKYRDFDARDRQDEQLVFEINYTFLENNKKIIITDKNIRELGYTEFMRLLFFKKNILVISKSKKNEKLFIIKQVYLSNNGIE